MDAITAAGLSPRTCQYARAVTRKMLTDAEKLDLVSRNVARLSTAPRREKGEVTPLTVEQARMLLDYVKGSASKSFIALPWLSASVVVRLARWHGRTWISKRAR